MINELYMLSKAMEKCELQVPHWNRKYKPIPNITKKAPCICINILNGEVTKISEVNKELGNKLRKYGNNQGTYPCMNIAPLYRITDSDIKKEIERIKPEELNDEYLRKIRGWCTQYNWNDKFKNKYKISMCDVPDELREIIGDYTPLNILMEETDRMRDCTHMHEQLKKTVFKMLEQRENISIAFKVLFHYGSDEKKAADDYGTLSVALESERLLDDGIAVVSEKFVKDLNNELVRSEMAKDGIYDLNDNDAFGNPFKEVNEPMPEVKLAGGFDVKLRSMFKEQHCQTRYNRKEDASYPISKNMRMRLQAALDWLGSTENKGKTWVNTDKNEILFVYPSELLNEGSSYTAMFKMPENNALTFQKHAEVLIKDLKKGTTVINDFRSNILNMFMLRKVDKARTKVVYTRQTNADELQLCCENWQNGFLNNLPKFPFGKICVPYPMQISDILNKFWKQDGKLVADKFKPIPKYHGVELLFEADRYVKNDLHILIKNAINIGPFLGILSAKGDKDNDIWKNIRYMIALAGFLLYSNGSGKDEYMEKLPYTYGQLLKVSDELHIMYCRTVRNGDIPVQLAGGSLFQAATEVPVRTLSILGQRMNPYIVWARSYSNKNVMDKGKESWRARWLLSLYERMAGKIYDSWTDKIKFTDEDKAEFFIGYLAAFPKNENVRSQLINNEQEENENE